MDTMAKEMDNLFYQDININQVNTAINKKNSALDNFLICDEIKKLENTLAELEEKKKSCVRLMFTIPSMSLAMGFTLSVGVAIFSTLENLTIQNFIENLLIPRNLYSFYITPLLFGLYYSWAIGTTDYQEIKSKLNIASLKLYFLKNNYEMLRNRGDLNEFFEKLSKYGEKMVEYMKKYKQNKWGIQEREMLAKDNLDIQIFENYLEESTRKRKIDQYC